MINSKEKKVLTLWKTVWSLWRTMCEKYRILEFIVYVIIVFGIWGGSWYFIRNHYTTKAPSEYVDARGTFGDMFGAVNALFTGLAFAGLIFTIRQQQKEIKDQAKENLILRFESRFFNMLHNFQELVNATSYYEGNVSSHSCTCIPLVNTKCYYNGYAAISLITDKISETITITIPSFFEEYKKYPSGAIGKYKGKLHTVFLKREAILNMSKSDFQDNEQWLIVQELNCLFNQSFSSVLSPYIMGIYEMLKTVDSQSSDMLIDSEKEQYCNMIKCYIPPKGLSLILFDLYRKEDNQKLKELILKYKILEDVPRDETWEKCKSILA